MKPEYWQKKWQDHDIRFHQENWHPQMLTHFPKLAPTKVLVPLCGKSRDLIWLASQGHEIIGVELSPLACQEFFAENSLASTSSQEGDFTLYRSEKITIWCGDFFATPPAVWAGVTAIYDRAALIALPPEMREKYTRHIVTEIQNRSLNTFEMLIIAIEHDGSPDEGPPFSVRESQIHQYYDSAFRVNCIATMRDEPLTQRLGIPVDEKIYRASLKL